MNFRYSRVNSGQTGPEHCPENDGIKVSKVVLHLATCSVALSRWTGQIFSQKPVDYLDSSLRIQSTTQTSRLLWFLHQEPVDYLNQSTFLFPSLGTSRLLQNQSTALFPSSGTSRLDDPATKHGYFRNLFLTNTETRVIPISVWLLNYSAQSITYV